MYEVPFEIFNIIKGSKIFSVKTASLKSSIFIVIILFFSTALNFRVRCAWMIPNTILSIDVKTRIYLYRYHIILSSVNNKYLKKGAREPGWNKLFHWMYRKYAYITYLLVIIATHIIIIVYCYYWYAATCYTHCDTCIDTVTRSYNNKNLFQ